MAAMVAASELAVLVVPYTYMLHIVQLPLFLNNSYWVSAIRIYILIYAYVGTVAHTCSIFKISQYRQCNVICIIILPLFCKAVLTWVGLSCRQHTKLYACFLCISFVRTLFHVFFGLHTNTAFCFKIFIMFHLVLLFFSTWLNCFILFVIALLMLVIPFLLNPSFAESSFTIYWYLTMLF